jgi:heme/copper-type cytochrome/quinol oxidase subunit 1
MTKHNAVRIAVRLYFLAALYFSFTHLTHAAVKLGATTVESVAATLMVDGFFVLGAILRSEDYSTRTRRIGLWVQTAAGIVSVAGNMFAANSAFGLGFGFALPFFVVFTEWLADANQLKTAAAEAAEIAAKVTAQIEAEAAAAAEAARAAKNAADRARRQTRKAEKERAERAETTRIRKATKTMEFSA